MKSSVGGRTGHYHRPGRRRGGHHCGSERHVCGSVWILGSVDTDADLHKATDTRVSRLPDGWGAYRRRRDAVQLAQAVGERRPPRCRRLLAQSASPELAAPPPATASQVAAGINDQAPAVAARARGCPPAWHRDHAGARA